MSFKKKIIKGFLGFSIVLSTMQFADFFVPQEADALGGIGGGNKVRQEYGERRGQPNATPVSIEFTRTAPQYNYYTRTDTPKNTFYEENYKNRFLWYSMVPRQGATAYESYMARMRENLQQELGTRQYEIDHYATHSSSHDFRYNLKTGQDSPFDNDGLRDGYNTGSQVVTYGPFKGYYFEWRYLGYSADGEPIGNPYFPDDYPAPNNSDSYWRDRNWVKFSWNDGYANFRGTEWDEPGNRTKKAQWFVKYLKPRHPGLFTSTKNEYYWADRLSLRTNPDLSTGIAEGWHISRSSNRHFYKTFVMESPKRPNLRITDLKIRDKDTNRVIGSATRSTSDPYNAKITFGSKDKYIHQGKTYVVEGTIRNMRETGMASHDTTYTPVHAELLIGYDQTVHEYNGVDEIYKGSNGCKPTTATNSIRYNTSQNFRCEFTIPNNFSKEIEIGLRIPYGFFSKGDNLNTEDDIAQLVFERSPNDMAISNTIEFIDQNGNIVNDVIPNHTYDARFYVSRPQGDTPVGAVGNANNPFATIDVTTTDKGTVNVSRKVVATEVLRKGRTVAITATDIIQPKTNVIQACAKINSIHVTKGQNVMNGNDGEVCRTIQSDINISLKDFEVKPKALYLPTGMSTSYQTLVFDFWVTNFNVQGHSKDIPYVIKKGNTTIATGSFDIIANQPIFKSVTVGNVPLSAGIHGFTVEVNPTPRKWFESVRNVSNPYLDNVASNSILVHPSPPVVKCDVENTRNTWTTTYSIYEWWGYQDSYYVNGYWNYNSQGLRTSWTPGYTVYYCVTTRTSRTTQTINHYEDYRIDKVLFKSKITQDNNGGWIDIKGGTEGKVKAGYGFELKVVARFTTNIHTAPKPWSSGCSGKSVSPSTGTVKAPERITITMPFKDLYGNNVKHTLNASVSGSWYDETQTYEMPMRNAFGLKNTREIFVNEGAKDGKYQVKIETDGNFRGSYDKPYSKHLCDIEYVNITIIGSDTDDLKTHITH